MYKYLVVLLLVNSFQQTKTPTIAWSEDYKVVWNDFKKVNRPTSNTKATATTASGISFGFSAKQSPRRLFSFDYHVVAHFYPDESWYLKGSETDVILKHERLHFDITELFARKFRQRIETSKFTKNIDQEMKRIHNKIIRELRAYQEKYDSETNHSINLEAQLKWQEKLVSELKALKAYQY